MEVDNMKDEIGGGELWRIEVEAYENWRGRRSRKLEVVVEKLYCTCRGGGQVEWRSRRRNSKGGGWGKGTMENSSGGELDLRGQRPRIRNTEVGVSKGEP